MGKRKTRDHVNASHDAGHGQKPPESLKASVNRRATGIQWLWEDLTWLGQLGGLPPTFCITSHVTVITGVTEYSFLPKNQGQ